MGALRYFAHDTPPHSPKHMMNVMEGAHGDERAARNAGECERGGRGRGAWRLIRSVDALPPAVTAPGAGIGIPATGALAAWHSKGNTNV